MEGTFVFLTLTLQVGPKVECIQRWMDRINDSFRTFYSGISYIIVFVLLKMIDAKSDTTH